MKYFHLHNFDAHFQSLHRQWSMHISMRVEKRQCCASSQKGTKNPYKIIVLCLYFQFAVKFLKDSYITRYLISFLKKSLIWANQSGFKPGNSCINQFFPNALFIYPLKTLENRKIFCCFQRIEKGCIGKKWINELLSIKHNIYKSFGDNYEVRGVFLDISKVFNEVRHDGLIFKSKKMGYQVTYSKFWNSFWHRKQRLY